MPVTPLDVRARKILFERSSPGEWSHVGMWRGADGYAAAQVKKLFGRRMKTTATRRRTSRIRRTS